MASPRMRSSRLACALLVTIGCRRDAPEVKRDPTPVASITATATASAAPKVPADLKIVLLRTMCYGECPAYALAIDAAGKVTFTGMAFVMTEHGDATISQADVEKLVAAIDDARFFSLEDVNPGWKDCSRSRTRITLGGKTKSVRDGCVGAGEDEDASTPDARSLEKLGDEIDRIVGVDRWIGPESKRRRLFDEPDAATAKTSPELDYWK